MKFVWTQTHVNMRGDGGAVIKVLEPNTALITNEKTLSPRKVIELASFEPDTAYKCSRWLMVKEMRYPFGPWKYVCDKFVDTKLASLPRLPSPTRGHKPKPEPEPAKSSEKQVQPMAPNEPPPILQNKLLWALGGLTLMGVGAMGLVMLRRRRP